MKNFIFKFILVFLTMNFYLFSEQELEINPIENFKKEIQDYYKPSDCFRLVFRTDMIVPEYGKQSVDGSVLADNKNNRIRIVLTESNLGLILSWITIIDKQAYLSNPKKQGVYQLSLDKLELGSLANNSIKFPFKLFQDILFGKLPEGLLESENWQYEEQFIGKYTGEDGDLITFYFDKKDSKRIEKIEYGKPTIGYKAIATFHGKFYDTKYPKILKILTYQNQKPLESMNIEFYRYINPARCGSENFPIK